MNIFALSDCPRQSAKWLCDKHVVKMIVESCQILCTAFHMKGYDAPYKPTHKNHPSCIWARQSRLNFEWLLEHVDCLCEEYTERYGKIHKSKAVVDWCRENVDKIKFDQIDQTDFAIAIAENAVCRKQPNFNIVSPVEKYRMYYIFDKKELHKWKQNKPHWIN